MLESMLQTMRSPDLDWLLRSGHLTELHPQQIISSPGDRYDQVYIALSEGVTLDFAQQESGEIRPVSPIGVGEIMGAVPALEEGWDSTTVSVQRPGWMVAIEREALLEQLSTDSAFAAGFYHSQAIALLRRLQRLLRQAHAAPALIYQLNAKAAASVFAQLQDSDLDWFVAVGTLQTYAPGQLLQPAHRPIDALQIVLEGALSLTPDPAETIAQSLEMAYRSAETADARPGKKGKSAPQNQMPEELARLGRGDLFGELALIQPAGAAALVQSVQVHALRDSEILAVPRWRLASKLLHDSVFALHVYRAIAALLNQKYHTLAQELGFVTHSANREFGDPLLSQMAIAEARFEWLSQRLQSTPTSGAELSW
jgi:CRP-like cAMP-binding protein